MMEKRQVAVRGQKYSEEMKKEGGRRERQRTSHKKDEAAETGRWGGRGTGWMEYKTGEEAKSGVKVLEENRVKGSGGGNKMD